jgi:hypothetical protein
MTGEEAEKIINVYGGLIANMPKGDRVQDVFSLPYSPARIRYAYYVYTEELINRGLFDDDIKQNLESTYALIDSRFIEADDINRLNKALRLYPKDEKAKAYVDKHGGFTVGLPSTEKMVEYHNFVADCYGSWGRS